MSSDEELRKQLAYYKKRTDELSGETVRLDIQISDMKLELAQKRKVLKLFSDLHRSLGEKTETITLVQSCITEINSTIGMDKTIFLVPTSEPGFFKPALWLGYKPGEGVALEEKLIRVPDLVAKGMEVCVVNSSREKSDFESIIEEAFRLPFFVAVGVMGRSGPIGVLVSGRMVERMPHYPALNAGDGESFQSIANMISATIDNLKLAALQEVDKLKTEFFANISHEFRTPITLTIGPLESIRDGAYGKVNPQVASMLEIMLRNQKNLLGLINEILDLAKLEAKAMKLKVSKIRDPRAYLESLVAPFVHFVNERGIELRFEASSGVSSADWYIDTEKFQKAFTNLLSNAAKFTSKGVVTVRAATESNVLTINVQDTGAGIRSDQLPHIFDRFQQAEGSESRTYAGTGIGLALVKEITELHHGKITVESELGQGTTFTMHFPLGRELFPEVNESTEDHLSASSPSSAPDGGSAEHAGLKAADENEIEDLNRRNAAILENRSPKRSVILYVDDNRDLRSYVSSILSESYDVLLAADGEMGLEVAKKAVPDLILSDLMMPHMTGSELLACVKADTILSAVPFVILTAKADLSDKLSELDQGADDYLSKPFSPVELAARVRNLLKYRAQTLKLKRDLQAAREIQQSLLPPPRLQVGSVSVEALYHPCEELSGDFYDTVEVGRWLYIYVADVTSHGTVSAQVTYMIKGIFQKVLQSASPTENLSFIMWHFVEDYKKLKLNQAVMLFLYRIDTETGLGEFCYSGLEDPTMVRNGKAQSVGKPSRCYIFKEIEISPKSFVVNKFSLGPGDQLFAFTDGCYEIRNARNGRELGYKRFHQMLGALPNDNWQENLIRKLQKISGLGDLADDITVVRIKAVG